MAFSFGFSGEDIDTSLDDGGQAPQAPPPPSAAGAFPVQGKPQLPPTHHPLDDALRRLPSRVSWSYLETTLDDGTAVRLPRRDLWDVRVQLMAEDDGAGADGGGGEGLDGLGSHDVKTGVYEGGFKSWESSIDLIKVLAANSEGCFSEGVEPVSVVELGCGTALPSLAILQTALSNSSALRRKLHLTLADYNPSVLLLVTLPNVLVTWALTQTSTPLIAEALAAEGELEISPELLSAFCSHLAESNISLSLLSGGWSPGFVDLIYAHTPSSASLTLMLGSETIYSPFALQSFTETIFSIYSRDQQRGAKSVAYVAAKKLYFGVGGSLDDFITGAQERGAMVKTMREELEGVRRGVVRCSLTDD